MSSYQTLASASDLTVIEAYRRDRSEAAARVLIDRFSARTLRTIARLLGDHADAAEDLLRLPNACEQTV